MVATRHSLPAQVEAETSASTSPAPSSDMNKRSRNVLKKLAIDGKSTMIGEKSQRKFGDTNTYIWHGGVYVWDEHTKPEWLAQATKRKHSLVATDSEADTSAVQSSEVGAESAKGRPKKRVKMSPDEKAREKMPPPAVKKSRKRPSNDAEAGKADSSKVEIENAKKRKLRMMESRAETAQEAIRLLKESNNSSHHLLTTACPASSKARPISGLDGADEEEEDEDEEEEEEQWPPPKRARRSLPDVNYRLKRKRNPASANTTPAQKPTAKSGNAEVSNSFRYDFTRVGGQQKMSCMQAQKAEAKKKGYQLKPFSVKEMQENEEEIEKQQQERLLKGVVQDLIELAKANTKVEELQEQYQQAGEQLAKFEPIGAIERTEDAGAGAIEDGNETTTSTPPMSNELAAARQHASSPQLITLAQLNGAQEPTPPPNASTASPAETTTEQEEDGDFEISGIQNADSPPQERTTIRSSSSSMEEVEIITSRHDSAASSLTPPAVITTAAVTITTAATKHMNNDHTPPPTGDLPQANKAGNRLRWSLPDRLTSESERAEAQIQRGRMEGESKAAKRRRIRREINVLKGWDVKVAGEGDGVEGAGEEGV